MQFLKQGLSIWNLTMQPRAAGSLPSSCICLLSAGIACLWHRTIVFVWDGFTLRLRLTRTDCVAQTELEL